ncbi:MAG: N,N'-diacetylchitobiose phosphorylase [Puniceicoccaceae bacterium]|nr:MAG: N,N'-diacetylchitobiose phosphorylase [Puniceicoccaceae bacterium]
MNYGYFDNDAREYIITRPDTPRSWSNYLGSRRYGGIITHQAGGYSFSHSPASGRFLRHRYNSVPADQPGRPFYLRDRDSGDFWSAAWQPVGKPLDAFRCTTRFGPGYASLESEYSGIRAESLYFVPLDQDFEYWRLRVTNAGKKARKLSVFSFAEFTTEWNLIQDTLNLQYTQFIARATWEKGFISVSSCGSLPAHPGDFAHRDQSRWWWMTQLGGTIAGHDCDREAFIGQYRSFHNPQAVEAGACTGSRAYADNPCGAIQSDLELAPGETAEILVLLGTGRHQHEGRRALKKFGSGQACEQEFARLKAHWHRLLDRCQVKTPDPAFDDMANVWGAYNALMTFLFYSSCSVFYTGDQRDGFGYRDTVQDVLGVTHLLPEVCRERLLLMLSGQDSTGGAQPEIRPWAHRPGAMPPTDPERYRSDDCLWFFNAIPAYVAETGDIDFYREEVPYADEGAAPVWGHLRRALEFNLERTGRNGLPCGLSADWNDCLKLGYHGESVFVAFQVRLGLNVYADLARTLGLPEERRWAQRRLKALDRRIAEVCWDGGWFIWAIGEDGTVYGTRKAKEGKIYLNTQCWAVLSGAADAAKGKKAMDAVQSRLATEFGVAMCAPPFVKIPVQVMRAVLFNPGTKENAGIFSHTQSWAVLAEIALGRGDRAYAYYRSFLPAAQNDRAELRQIEPYVHCQSTHSQFSEQFGVSRVPWLSGTASWAHYTALQHILGIRPEVDGLRIDPCLPKEWPGFTARRLFRGKTIHIEVSNPDRKNRGLRSLECDGQPVEGTLIPADQLKEGSQIRAIMG